VSEPDGTEFEELFDGQGVAANGDRLLLFYVYGDKDDVPLLVRNPPPNLPELLAEWNDLDRRTDGGEKDEAGEWDFVSKWLEARGVEVISVASIRLDSYHKAQAVTSLSA
jgi:hypothetical protein